MALLHVCGITCLYSTFVIAYCLLSAETTEAFEWVLHGMKTLIAQFSIKQPIMIISDYDRVFKAAARNILNDCQH